MNLKFGKLAPKYSPKTLYLMKYLGDIIPTIPSKVYWEYLVKNWPMMLNDSLGDCVFASGGHMVQNWSAHTGSEIIVPDSDVQAAYSAVGGYDPSQIQPDGSNPTDDGAAITDFLTWWQSTPYGGTTILGWAAINPGLIDRVKEAVYLFGSLDIGFQVPSVAMDQFRAGMPWDVVTDDGGIVGGHSVPIMGFGSGGFACITWGKIQYMTNAFFSRYCDESYGIITEEWLNSSGIAPNNMNLDALKVDLEAIKA